MFVICSDDRNRLLSRQAPETLSLSGFLTATMFKLLQALRQQAV
jgi:hypothetical protein